MSAFTSPAGDGPDLRSGEVVVPLPCRVDAALVFIGRIDTPWKTRAACPRRGDVDGPACRIVVDALWHAALDGLRPGAILQVLYWMHLARRDLVHQHPRGRGGPIGTFALRSPVRPNPIASSSVRLVACDGGVLTVRGLDCIDGTPLLDLKPDRCPQTSSGQSLA